MVEYRPRFLDAVLDRLLSEQPGVLIVGPRAAGKTTTAARHSRTIIHLDQPKEADAFRADPDVALRDLPEPVLLDEWQMVPDVLGAVKRAIDRDPRPGRFLVTGSVRSDLESPGWPATGRLTRLPLYGMSVAEQQERITGPRFVDRVVAGQAFDLPPEVPDIHGYVELALRGGYPQMALYLSESTRQSWVEGYVEQVVLRDSALIDGPRDPDRLRRYLEAYALSSAGIPSDRTLWEAAAIDRRTASAYEQLLINLLVIEHLPAWSSNRLKRLTLSPKRYLVDPSLMAGILNVNAAAVLRDGDLLGRLLDTFVAAQLRAERAASTSRPRFFHLREEHGRHEVDLLAEVSGRAVIGFEVKSSSSVGRGAAKHLEWLRDHLGTRFAAGIVFHTGPRAFVLSERIHAVPIAALWG